jgi:hypothetical protein
LFTKNLPTYFLLKVSIYIQENKSISFSVDLPSIGFFLNLLKFEKILKIKIFGKFEDQLIIGIELKEILKLAILKFPLISLISSISIISGSLKSMNILIISNYIRNNYLIVAGPVIFPSKSH